MKSTLLKSTKMRDLIMNFQMIPNDQLHLPKSILF
jgi:hypothetical protein